MLIIMLFEEALNLTESPVLNTRLSTDDRKFLMPD